MITTFLFDLDGTLLPMDQDIFLKAYMGGLAAKMAQHGYEPKGFIKAIWKGTEAMVKNDGQVRNDVVFWSTFSALMNRDTKLDEPLFEEFYKNEFQDVRHSCGFEAQSSQLIRELKSKGFRIVLATNPLFPAIATHSRVRWAGMEPEDFELITTYENSFHCKPNLDYYRDILQQLKVTPAECVMIGNDASEDMIAEELGMNVFLLTDCTINKENKDISCYPHGGFSELFAYTRGLR